MLSYRTAQAALALACAFGSATAVHAQTRPQPAARTLSELAQAAQFVVHTRVSRIDYRLSDPGPNGQTPLPYTLVTYDVLRALRGAAAPAAFTLRYIGGPDGRGRFLQVSEVPVFQVGDEDILFVQENGTRGCALAGCVDGRFRLLGGAVHDGTGVPVQGIEGDRIVLGGAVPVQFRKFSYPAPSFDQLMQNPQFRDAMARSGVSLDEARRLHVAHAPAQMEIGITSGPQHARGDSVADHGGLSSTDTRSIVVRRPMSAETFIASLQQLPAARLAPAAAFQSVDAQAPIAMPSMQPAAPAAAPFQAEQRRAADSAGTAAQPTNNPASSDHKTR